MEIRCYIDRETEQPHIHGHGVTEQGVAEVLSAPLEERDGAAGAWVAVGRREAGRLRRVIFARGPDPDSIFVLTAYELTGRAAWALRRRMRWR